MTEIKVILNSSEVEEYDIQVIRDDKEIQDVSIGKLENDETLKWAIGLTLAAVEGCLKRGCADIHSENKS